MVPIDLIYEGGLRVRAIHGPSKTELVTDAPVDNQGKGESFSPSDLVVTALGACMATIMGIVAERHQWDLKGMKVALRKHMVTEPVRRIGKIEVHFRIPNVKEEKDRKLLENAAYTCPVCRSLSPDIEKEIKFEWV
jgi:putative redox protein